MSFDTEADYYRTYICGGLNLYEKLAYSRALPFTYYIMPSSNFTPRL